MKIKRILKSCLTSHLIYLTIFFSGLLQTGFIILYPQQHPPESDLNAEYRVIQLIDIDDRTEQIQNSEHPAEVQEIELADEIKQKPSPITKLNALQKVQAASGGTPQFYSQFVIDELPYIKTEAAKKYPALAKEKGKEGRVVLEIYLDAQGTIVDIHIIENPGYGFADAALEYIRNSVWEPAKHQGKAVAVRIRKPLAYTLDQ